MASNATILAVINLFLAMASICSMPFLIFIVVINFAVVAAGMMRRNEESSSTSWSSSGINHEVFLNFRGEDTRQLFTDLLYEKLKNAGIEVFKDDETLRAGEEINQGLKDAIERSTISIAIFSKDYASSKSCLMELVQMWECRNSGQTIIPIFYDVSPDVVQEQTGSFATSFEQHMEDEEIDSHTINTWKDVLQQVGGLTGYERAKISGGRVSVLLEKVLQRVKEVLKTDDQSVTDKLVGIDVHVQEMMTKLGVVYSHGQAIDVCGEDVRVIGICGFSGVGKTTLAKVVFNKIYKLFEGRSFLEVINLEGVSDQRKFWEGVKRSQENLIADLRRDNSVQLKSSDEGTIRLGNQFNTMKVLIVLDNVSEKEQIEALIGKRTWFGSGSRVIVTTNDKNVFNGFNDEADRLAVKEHIVDPMSKHHALQLFREHAFRGDAPQNVSEYGSLSIKLVKAIGGLPLAIKVMAKDLSDHGEDIEIWKETFELLEKNQEDPVKNVFKASYESLDIHTREIFLDIACFFIGKDARIPSYMWKACGYSPARGIKRLCNRYLLEIGANNELRMHDLLRDFGRKLVKDKELHQRSRLWNHSDAFSILDFGTGTESVQGIGFTFEDDGTACFMCEKFQPLSNLRYLRLDRAIIDGNTENLLPKMRWLDWRGCPLISQLGNMHLKELVILDLSWSRVTNDSQVWGPIIEKVKKLKVLNLQECFNIGASLNFPAPIDLELLILEGCALLPKIGPSISNLKTLTTLNLKKCRLVKELPRELGRMEFLRELLIDETGIENILFQKGSFKNLHILSARDCQQLRHISTIGHLRNLSSLILDGAAIKGLPHDFKFPQTLRILSLKNCRELYKLPTSIGELKQLEVMDLSYTGITEMPHSVKELSNLKTLNMERTYLQEFPEEIVNLAKLEEIDFSLCKSLEGSAHCDISRLSSLRILNLRSSKVARLPKNICRLSHLETLDLRCCDQLHTLPKLPSSLLSLRWRSEKVRVPDLSYLTNLKELVLKDVTQPRAGWLMRLSNRKTPNIGWITRLSTLETLKLSLSKVTSLPGNFSALTQLQELSLSYMKGLDLSQFPSSLLTLRLKHCKIQEPKFSGLEYLSELELDHCNLANINGLEDLKLLEVLRISQCSSVTNLNGLKELCCLRKVKVFPFDPACISEISEPTFELDTSG